MIRRMWETLVRAVAVMRRRSLDREFDEEFETHIALLADENERRGMSRDEARRRAILQMGGLNPTRDVHRESRGLPVFERFLDAIKAVGKDFRHAARSLVRARMFAFVCVVSLGIGMGVFVALVTFVRGMTMPARGVDTAGLVELLVRAQGPLQAKVGVDVIEEWSYPDFETLRQMNTGMSLAGWAGSQTDVGIPIPATLDREAGQDPARVLAYFVSANYFDVLGVSLMRGPGFDPVTDDRPSVLPKVVVSHTFWLTRLASDPDVIGQTLTMGGVAHTIVGIAPAEFRGPFNPLVEAPSAVLFVPLERHPRLLADSRLRTDRTLDWVHIYGRLMPGVDIAQANGSVSTTMAVLAAEYPATNAFKAASVEPYFPAGARQRDEVVQRFGMILGLAGLVLLIVCVNISGMMLVRGAARERELSIREAVGASRLRLIQFLFFEAVWLAAIGGGMSVLVLFGIPASIAWWIGTSIPPELDFDATGAVIAASLCLAVSLVLGLLPALRLSRPNLITALKDDVSGGGLRVGRIHRAVTAIQVAIAIPFLVLAGVMLDRVRTADFGFDPEGLVAARVDPASASRNGRANFSLSGIQSALEETNGVLSVTMADGMPIDFDQRRVRLSPNGTQFVNAKITHVAEGYLDTLGARLLRGRGITAEDRRSDARVIVISEPLASTLFPGGDAIGERLTLALEEGLDEEFTIVGVAADFATSQLTTERPQILLPLSESPTSPVFLIARGAATDEMRLVAAFENVGRAFDLEFLPARIRVFPAVVTGTQLVQKSLQDLVSESIATAVAGGMVLVLASLGILGVVAFMVATRTREIAVRMALGATRWRVVGLMLIDVVKLVAPGVIVGLLIGAVLIRTLDTFMETPLTVGPTPLGVVEPLVYVAAASVAVAVALLAGLPAARRAASIQPMIAMRSE